MGSVKDYRRAAAPLCALRQDNLKSRPILQQVLDVGDLYRIFLLCALLGGLCASFFSGAHVAPIGISTDIPPAPWRHAPMQPPAPLVAAEPVRHRHDPALHSRPESPRLRNRCILPGHRWYAGTTGGAVI